MAGPVAASAAVPDADLDGRGGRGHRGAIAGEVDGRQLRGEVGADEAAVGERGVQAGRHHVLSGPPVGRRARRQRHPHHAEARLRPAAVCSIDAHFAQGHATISGGVATTITGPPRIAVSLLQSHTREKLLDYDEHQSHLPSVACDQEPIWMPAESTPTQASSHAASAIASSSLRAHSRCTSASFRIAGHALPDCRSHSTSAR